MAVAIAIITARVQMCILRSDSDVRLSTVFPVRKRKQLPFLEENGTAVGVTADAPTPMVSGPIRTVWDFLAHEWRRDMTRSGKIDPARHQAAIDTCTLLPMMIKEALAKRAAIRRLYWLVGWMDGIILVQYERWILCTDEKGGSGIIGAGGRREG